MASGIKGLPELQRKLKALQEKTAPKIALAMEQAAQRTVDLAKSLVPVDSGDLRNSIGWTWGEAPKGSIKLASTRAGATKLTIFAGDDKAFYARWVEFGTAPHANGGQFAGTQNPGTRAQPFFYPAWRATKKQVQGMLRKAIRDAVKEAVRA